MGRGYVIEHCVSTLNSLREEDNYRIYLTEVLRGIYKSLGGEMKIGYSDFLKKSRKPQKITEERTPEDIINAIKAKAELIDNGTYESCGEGHA